jgi:predicted deacylase
MSHALHPYPSPDEREQELERLAAAAGGRVLEYGRSVEDAPLRAAVVPAAREGAPRVLCSANIHGPEYVAGRVAMGLLAALGPDGAARPLLDRAEVWVIPCLNPDGYRRTHEREGRGPLTKLRPNANGVDLNRNFPLPSGRPSRLPAAGSTTPGAATYRGPHPLSEPETRHLDVLFAKQSFRASANFHSFMGTCIPARVTDREAFRRYKQLCRAFRDAQPSHHYRRLSTRLFDVFTGEQEDHQHHRYGTWAICVETFTIPATYRQHFSAPSTFWRFNPHDPTPWVDNDVAGVAGFFQAALELG